MTQIPLSFAAPWNFTAEEIEQAERWIYLQSERDPENEGIQAAYKIITVIADEYRHQIEDESTPPQGGGAANTFTPGGHKHAFRYRVGKSVILRSCDQCSASWILPASPDGVWAKEWVPIREPETRSYV